MKVKVTKKAAIKAVMTEPLRAGNWFYLDDTHDLQTCDVCAVGAVLRNSINLKKIKSKFNDSYIVHDIAENVVKFDEYTVSFAGYESDREGGYLEAMKNKEYMAALSMYFEHLSYKIDKDFYYNGKALEKQKLDVIRLALHDFIVAEFPESFYIYYKV